MYLKSIDINGFKSFANKISFEFPHGITGIVGPNGSGKSNIADAVRWVLGEQSARQLRGTRMEDVIFSGTEQRRPMGYAYVAITFDNSAHAIPVDYEEVTVARRVYRSGESEYILNGSVCRRRDIVALFYDTGIGKEGYSIIGQGQVEKILSGKIEDSRELFDEAAGIAKYKKNRALTQKSLDQERANLERVTDILGELEKQIGPLKEQSEKAKEYLKLRDQEKKLDYHLFLYDYDRIQKELASVTENAQIIEGDLVTARDRYQKIKDRSNEITNQADRLNEDLEAREGTYEEIRSQSEETENKILYLRGQIKANEQMQAHYKELAENEAREAEDKKYQNEENSTLLSEKEEALSREEKALDQVNEELEEKTGIRDSLEAKLRLRREELIESMSEHTGIKEQMSRYRTMQEQIHIRNAQYNSRLLTAEQEKESCRLEMESLDEEIGKAREEVSLLTKRKEEAVRLEEEAYRSRKDKREERNRLSQEYLRARSRHEALLSMADRYEGYNRASRFIMEQKASRPEIIGVVADILTMNKEYETAIEIALGGALQYIVTENNQVARDMIRILKDKHLGRATFLPLTDVRRRNIAFSPSILEDEGVVGVASKLVEVEDRYRGLTESLLGRTIVVDTVENALSIARKNNFSLRLVTLSGELLSPGGSITGGAYKNNSNLLSRRREVEESRKTAETSLSAYEKSEKQVEESKEVHRLRKDQLARSEETLSQAELVLHDLENRRPALEEKLSETEKEIRVLRSEQRILSDQLTGLIEQIENLEQHEEDSEASHELNQDTIQELVKEVDELSQVILGIEKTRNERTLRVSTLKQEIEYQIAEIARISDEITRNLKNAAENREAYQKLLTENEDILSRITDLERQAQELKGKSAEIADSLMKLKKDRADLSRKQGLIISELEEENTNLLRLEKESDRLDARKEKLKTDLDSSIEYMWDTYEETYNHVLAQKEYDLKASQIAKSRKEKKEISKAIRSLGNVNVNAIEEYREVGQRYDFTKQQVDDIREAEEQLVTMINELNQAMRERFTTEFANIREMFAKVFADLFEGGTADLQLIDENDILESGIRIIAQPPGKKLVNILLLSGGERALTAIALLFAIQNLKPSPFCLLDEIEAALDDANILRFARYLRVLSKDTQFIVITHRKGTMNAADSLYGITMQEKGVSTLISVDLIDKELK